MSIRYMVSYPRAEWRYSRSMCGINTWRTTAYFTHMTTVRSLFDTLEDAQWFIRNETRESNMYRASIPIDPVRGREDSQHEWRDLTPSDFTITLEGAV